MCEVRGSGVGLPSFTPIWCSPFLPCVSPTYVGMGYGLDLGSGYLKSAVSRRRIIVDMDFFDTIWLFLPIVTYLLFLSCY